MKNILSKLSHYPFVKKEKATIKFKIVGLAIIALSLVFIAGCGNNNNDAANKAAADKRYNDSVSQSKNRGEGEHAMEGHGPMNGHDSSRGEHKRMH